MNRKRPRLSFLVITSILLTSLASGVRSTSAGPCGDIPDEVGGVLMDASARLNWLPDVCATSYNVYRGDLGELLAGQPAACHGHRIVPGHFPTSGDPDSGKGYFFLVTGLALEEGSPGHGSDSVERALLGSCDSVTRNHVLDRTGFGWNEWTRDRIATLDTAGYIAEQLDPSFIDEASNAELTDRLVGLEPPGTIQELQGLSLVRAVYGRRQLEQSVAIFWDNHFNTEYGKSFSFFNFFSQDAVRKRLEATTLHYRESKGFRNLAFSGSFRQILDASAYSPAMIIFLDTSINKAGRPNENYARELLELHTLGVDGGYTDFDIVELARIFTGWNVCKKETVFVDDPLAACVDEELIGGPSEPEGLWVANFRVDEHDCQSKVLFQGTPEETFVPDTCSNPTDGVTDAQIALDAIASHPSTARFVVRKLLQKFVTDEPTTPMIDRVVAIWDTAGNPHGVGDLQAVLTEVLAQTNFLDPDEFRNKVKTPFEHVASAFRAVRGETNGTSSQVRDYLKRMGHLLHQNSVPTGYPEAALAWIDTNNMLERQKFGADMADGTGSTFGTDVTGLLLDNGVSTSAGNAAEIVDFLADAMFGGAISPAERQHAIDFLVSDDSGNPDPDYNLARIRQTVGYLLGYAQFLEQ